MESIAREQIRIEATRFAQDLTALLERENAESRQTPLRAPSNLTEIFRMIYMRVVSQRRMVTP
jgi:hypothetical protein